MKIAVLSESSADEAAVRVLVDAILGGGTQSAGLPRLVRRGYPTVLQTLPKFIMHCHYQTDADALVVVVDSNGSPIHDAKHDKSDHAEPRCRFCILRDAVKDVLRRLQPRPVGTELRVAVGLATPAIEAWYRCGLDPHAIEGAWHRDLRAGVSAPTAIEKLKRAVYGTEIPLLPLETRCAVEQAARLAADIAMLEKAFPNGFGPLAREVRGW